MKEIDKVIRDENIEHSHPSPRETLRAMYYILENRAEKTKLENQDNSNLFNTFDKSDVLDPRAQVCNLLSRCL